LIDIHSHILHGLDDGPRTFEESITMARMAVAAGTTDIVATPHANNQYPYDPELVEQKLAELRQAVGGAIRIHRGCDFHLTPENIADALHSPAKYSIGGNGYLLVEFSDYMVPDTAAEIFGRMLGAGLRPIVTHPERNPLLQKKMELIEGWVERGCLVQVTAHAPLGRFGKTAKAFADRLLANGLVHFLASDAHDCKYRTPALAEPWQHIAKDFGEPAARLLLETNPAAALAGSATPPAPARTRKKWFGF
jgi:protein-tyrosine phosphatase